MLAAVQEDVRARCGHVLVWLVGSVHVWCWLVPLTLEAPMPHTARRAHTEGHRSDRIGWLRAAVLGANDGIVSTASLVVAWRLRNRASPPSW